DYNVTRSIYEDMLSRKEKARLSMTLDIEGQGVTYRVQEPPVYPIEPKGLRFRHFAIAAPVLGLLAPIGLFGLYILLDPRVRTPGLLSALDDVELLGVIPAQRIKRSLGVRLKDIFLCGFLIAATLAAYASVTAYRLMGVL
ncbi:chain length-determining protein, partial [bacterium]|nr:chain length-determining protein [bacterium]